MALDFTPSKGSMIRGIKGIRSAPRLTKFKNLVVLCTVSFIGYYGLSKGLELTTGKTLPDHAAIFAHNIYQEKKQEVKEGISTKIVQVRQENPKIESLMLFIEKYGATKEDSQAINKTGKTSGKHQAPTASNQTTTSSPGVDYKPVTVSQAQKDFTLKHFDAAKKVEAQSLIPATFMIGQAGHETGWGRKEILNQDGTPSYNLFGIKPGANWNGRVTKIMTTEYKDGQPHKMVQTFRAYSSYEESFKDYANLINTAPRYKEARQAAHDFALALQKAGYATDPTYAQKLERSIGVSEQQVASKSVSPNSKTKP